MQPALLSEENLFIRIIVEPRLRWLRHLMLFLLVFVAYNSVTVTYLGSFKILGKTLIVISILQLMFYLGVVYGNIYYLVPKFFLKNRFTLYIVSLASILSLIFISNYIIEYVVHRSYSIEPAYFSYINESHSVWADYISEAMVMGICCFGTTITIVFRNWFIAGKRRSELESESVTTELRRLKNSVSPAFLSETLDSAARQTTSEPTAATEILARLSKFLRYRLYDASRERVMLNSDITFMENYLTLTSLVRENFTFRITTQGRLANTTVLPSVFMRITEAITDNIPADMPLEMELRFSTPGQNIAFEIDYTSTPRSNTYRETADKIGHVLALAYPGTHKMTMERLSSGPQCDGTENVRITISIGI